jgi:RNA polymerase sigma-70 factor (ECF subfamily)
MLPAQDHAARIYMEARDDVYRYLLTLGLSPAQAQDTAQDVFLRLYEALLRGEQIQNTRAWAFRVAHNQGLKAKARKDHANAPLTAGIEETHSGEEASAEDALLSQERIRRLREALASLSPRQRQCLVLRSEGLRYREIGEALGMGASTVGEFLERAFARLRKAMA